MDKELIKKLNKISSKDVELYLQLWGYDSVEVRASEEYASLYNARCTLFESGKEKMIVSEYNENQVIDTKECERGFAQFLYEVEAMADIPSEVRQQIKKDDWINFVKRFVNIYIEQGWNVTISKNIRFNNELGLNVIDCENIEVSNKMMIIDSGNGGKIKSLYDTVKEKTWLESIRLVVLFRAYVIEILLRYFKYELEKKEVSLCTVNWLWALNNPLFPQNKISSSDVQKRKKYQLANIVNCEESYKNYLEEIYQKTYDLQYIKEIMDIPNRLNKGIGKVQHEDRYGRYLNVVQGERKTANQPKDYDNTIYLIGGCVFFGYAVEDKYTMASYLQGIINHSNSEKKWRVVNYGNWGADIDWTYAKLYDIEFRPGDIVVASYAGYMPLGEDWQNYDISTSLSKLDCTKEMYFNSIIHCNMKGYELVSKSLYDVLKGDISRDVKSSECFYLPNSIVKWNQDEYLEEYLQEVKASVPKLEGKQVGAIVMNCNPFTLGHKYLIECASKKVDILIVFVVEENKSYFGFADRFNLVKEGTKDISNVYVVPSGKLIISTVTFPAYFLKDTKKEVSVDTSTDLTYFGEFISANLNIKYRFVGDEPIDVVTNCYNQTMKQVLPKYGIEVVEIPRKESQGGVISASRVRKLIEEQDFDTIKKLVPETTYNFLYHKFNVNHGCERR